MAVEISSVISDENESLGNGFLRASLPLCRSMSGIQIRSVCFSKKEKHKGSWLVRTVETGAGRRKRASETEMKKRKEAKKKEEKKIEGNAETKSNTTQKNNLLCPSRSAKAPVLLL